jgi:DNA-binding PadR family transcriptional regulator
MGGLTTVSYVVLGLVGHAGAATSYDLKVYAGRAIANFWPFPRSQLYAEPARLVGLGLLAEQREGGGRRRRTYSLTPEGHDALQHWLRDTTREPPQLRDLGLLKLFFGDLVEQADIVALARAEESAHRERLAHFEEIDRNLAARAEAGFVRATLQMGLACERAFVDFWHAITEDPPRTAHAMTPRPAGTATRRSRTPAMPD